MKKQYQYKGRKNYLELSINNRGSHFTLLGFQVTIPDRQMFWLKFFRVNLTILNLSIFLEWCPYKLAIGQKPHFSTGPNHRPSRESK